MYQRRFLFVALLCVSMNAGLALAQDAEGSSNAQIEKAGEVAKSAASTTATESGDVYRPVDTAEREAALESLRYKHLWIAYGLIWLIIFLFMYRTYQVGRRNRETLDTLKARLAQLEKRDG